ncbi:FRG domain-containing protein [Chryseobacterium fluminis]|uniref:FRG domain-containing protein n=1 Tax=Chryseobacterium fluminis TaxID=2983606 RepID=UPI00225673EF|nr:FRG domain-containing protein [Chryseobacterium sp. MMS21-Ot14]UZT97049.1 FRG domain-containing protein [Chryseobacterium sp. MMS21-Ot14]
MTTIKSVTEYLELIKGLEIKDNVFFRGHANENYVLEPGIYRKVKGDKTLVEFEDQIFREVISKSPQEFVGKTTLESLALMQHYESPTRVLDLTENSLVALFFAVNKGNENGEVIIFDIPDEFVGHYNSDRVTILSNIAKCGKDFNFNFGLVPFYRNKIDELKSKKVEIELTERFGSTFNQDITDFFILDTTINEWIEAEKYELENIETFYENLKRDFEENKGGLIDVALKDFRNSFIEKLIGIYKIGVSKSIQNVNYRHFGKLLHNIREDKAYFDSIIDPYDVSKVFAVRPKLDNPRIVRQHGAFLIFGIHEVQFTGFGNFKPMADLNREWILKGIDEERILVDKDSKRSILEELEQLGINQSTLFPEVDKVADFVRKKYQDKL